MACLNIPSKKLLSIRNYDINLCFSAAVTATLNNILIHFVCFALIRNHQNNTACTKKLLITGGQKAVGYMI